MKDFINAKFSTLSYIFTALLVCFFLVVFRIKTTHEFFGLFLIWNLFLAFIPLGIAWWISNCKPLAQNAFYKGFFTFLWLLFLPNAPYVLTDFVHLERKSDLQFIYDFTLLTFFSLFSLYMGLLSLVVMHEFWKPKLKKKVLQILPFLIFTLCGYGIYLGRILRFNSWDLFTRPLTLFKEVAYFIKHPFENWPILAISLFLGLMLTVMYNLLKPFLINANDTQP